jgi:hypothetical protein
VSGLAPRDETNWKREWLELLREFKTSRLTHREVVARHDLGARAGTRKCCQKDRAPVKPDDVDGHSEVAVLRTRGSGSPAGGLPLSSSAPVMAWWITR